MATAGGLAGVRPGVAPPRAVAARRAGLSHLRRVPALDGLRGVAVAVVVAFHLDHLEGGFLGVDLFFVLSGFLITSLLVNEHADRGAIALGRFWSRRARRLLPALLLVVAAVAVLIATLTPAGERPGLRGEALATLGYVANWQAMGDEVGYWDMFTQPSPLDHMWSLAIEEQFYVVWPLAVLGLAVVARRAHRRLTTVLAVASAGLAAVSFAVLAATWSPLSTNRAYYGTDARIGPTLLGAALAALTAAHLDPAAAGERAAAGEEPAVDAGSTPAGARALARHAAGLLAAAVMAVGFVSMSGQGSAYYRGGLVAFAAAAVVVVHVVTADAGGPLGRVLAARPLAALGVISYGVYLWHWPVIVYLTPERARVDGVRRDLLVVAVTLALATASHVLVERPIRRGALGGRRVRLALLGAVAATVAGVLVATSGVARLPGTDVAGGSGTGYATYPDEIPAGARRVLLVGDSGPIYLAPALADAARRHGAVVASDARPFCTILDPVGRSRTPDGVVKGDQPCHDGRRDPWSDLVERFDPDVVVYYIAAGGGLAEVQLEDGRWVEECHPDYDRYLADALRRDADLLGAGGATVVLATTPVGPFVTADDGAAAAVGCRRATLEAVAAMRPGTVVLDMAAVVERGAAQLDAPLFRDPVHLSDEGAELVADWLVPAALEVARPDPEEEAVATIRRVA